MACTVRVPTENVKQNMQMAKFGESGAPGALRATVAGLVKERGYAGMWRGYGTTVMREVGAIPASVLDRNLFVSDSILLHPVPDIRRVEKDKKAAKGCGCERL